MPDASNLRPYQTEAAFQVEALWDRGRKRVLVPHAAGTGKTTLGAYLIRAWQDLKLAERYGLPRRVLWTAYTDEQINQAVETIGAWTGETPAIEKADRSISREPAQLGKGVVVTSVQTMMMEDRLKFFGPNDFGLIIPDECHHAVCDGFQPILRHFPKACMAGLTATVNRTDKVPLGRIFDAATPVYGMADAMKDGWLCRLLYKCPHDVAIDWSRAFRKAELSEDRVAEIIENEGDELHAIVRATLDYSEGRQTIIYLPRVLAAQVVTDLINNRPDYRKYGAAEFVSGQTPVDQRRDIVARFREGQFRFLANSQVFAEGTDLRNASCAVLARLIKSEMLWGQIVGRILRGGPKDPVEGKTNAILLDLFGSSRKHKLVSPVDVLGGKWDACVRDEAYARLVDQATEVPVDVLELIEQAKAEAEQIRLKERRKIIAEIKAKVKTIDPFQMWPEAGADTEIDPGWWEHRLADEEQAERLKALGIPPKGLTAIEADKLLREAARRRKEGLCSYKASRQLRVQGITTDLTHEQAKDIMQFLDRTGGFRPTPDAFQRAAVARKRGRLFAWNELNLSYKVPAGTPCEVMKVPRGNSYSGEGETWHRFTTENDNSFARPETHSEGCAYFTKDDWRLRVPRSGYIVTLLGWRKKPIGAKP